MHGKEGRQISVTKWQAVLFVVHQTPAEITTSNITCEANAPIVRQDGFPGEGQDGARGWGVPSAPLPYKPPITSCSADFKSTSSKANQQRSSGCSIAWGV